MLLVRKTDPIPSPFFPPVRLRPCDSTGEAHKNGQSELLPDWDSVQSRVRILSQRPPNSTDRKAEPWPWSCGLQRPDHRGPTLSSPPPLPGACPSVEERFPPPH